MLRLTLVQTFARPQVTARWVPSGRRIVPAVEAALETAWQAILARPGVRLYDGPICRFESATVTGDRLDVALSRTSYRVMAGTNFAHPEFADAYGPDVMGNGLGVSTGVVTADGYWVFGRRNHTVAYYPGRIHPFAGSIEVTEHVDLFDNARRELREELDLADDEIADTLLVGLAEDTLLRHPEAIFFARTTRTRDELAAGLDRSEHDHVTAFAADAATTGFALEESRDDRPDGFTPVARAALLLGGGHLFGKAWIGHYAKALGVEIPGSAV